MTKLNKKSKVKDNYVKNRSISLLILFIIYKIILDYVYLKDLGISFSYMLLEINVNTTKVIISYLLVFFSYFVFKIVKGRISKYLVLVLLLFIYIPCLSYYGMNNQSTIYTLLLSASFIVVSLFSNIKIRRSKKYNSILNPDSCNFVVENERFSLVFILVYILFSVILVLVRGGIDYRALSFKTIYSLRSENNISGFLGYIMNWIPKFFFPLLASIFISKKRYFLLFIIIAFELLLYLSFGNKAFLFCIVWVILCFYLTKKNLFFIGLPVLLIVGVLVSYLLNKLIGFDSLRNTLNLRLIFVPAQIQYQYYDYFSVNEKMYFAENIIGRLMGIPNRFGEDVAYFIGRLYGNGGETHSNTGIFADAYYNFGFVGMVIISALTGLLFSIYDSFTGTRKVIIIGSLSYIMFSFMDTSLLTTLLTGGLMFNIVFLYYYNYKEISSFNKYIYSNKMVNDLLITH